MPAKIFYAQGDKLIGELEICNQQMANKFGSQGFSDARLQRYDGA